MRVGIGYDVHKLAGGRKLILGGVEIAHEKGLLGHSDADVIVHAVMDALVGAAKLGDIGVLLLKSKGYNIVNIDSIIIAQAPKLRPFIAQMEINIADALEIDVERISVKATTEEGLGFTGAKEGISSQAVCLID